MTPAARAEAAIDILDQVLAGQPAEAALLRWARASRHAGSGDRAAVRDLVFDCLRRRRSRAALGGALSGRGLMLGACREEGIEPATIFSGARHAPAPLSAAEMAAGGPPDAADDLDLPDWLIPDWTASLGEQARPVARALRDRAAPWLRVNLLRAPPDQARAALARDGIEVEPSPLLDHALRVVAGARAIARSAAYRGGLVELQDLSPQLACAALPRARRVLDYCAGGGGKALALAAAGAQEVWAHDADAARMADLPERARRAGARIRMVAPGEVRGSFDLVMADVPCSGSGTWRRNPDAKWRLDPLGLEAILALQARILDQAARHVAPGGRLAYMTCSLLDRENRAQIEAFLGRAPFRLEGERRWTPLDASDGFYLAILGRC